MLKGCVSASKLSQPLLLFVLANQLTNAFSAAINKWLKPRVPEGCVIHSFRHSLRDRLRAVECPSDIIDAFGGWTTTGVGQRYGTGQPLEVKAKWMDRLVDQD